MISLNETIGHIAVALIVGAATAGSAGAATGPPTLADACGSTSGLEAKTSWLTTGDGVRLYAIEAGSGTTAIVLAHQGQSTLCDTLSYAPTLVAAGFRVLAFDFRGWGQSERPSRNRLALGSDLAAAVGRARAGGAEHVFLIGASMGGAAVVQNSSSLDVDGRISLSGTRLWPGYGINHPGNLPRIRAPFLYVGTRDDRRAPLKEALGIFRRIGAPDKRTALYPGTRHGWQLVDTAPFAARARALIVDWIRRVSKS
jgi:alpha-beta hydrolase superfamily lysophospholipase